MTTSPARGLALTERLLQLKQLRLAVAARSVAIDRRSAALAIRLADAAAALCQRSGIPIGRPGPHGP